MYAIIETGGKQFKVSEGDVIRVEKLGVGAGENFRFEKVLAVADGESVNFGAPYLQGASVSASIIGDGKEKKVIIYKFKSKKGFHKKKGSQAALYKGKNRKNQHMINVIIYRNKEHRVCGFTVSNHGKSIVCAAVSILVQNTINSIEAFTEEPFNCEYEENGGYIKVDYPDINERDSKEAYLLLDSMVLGLFGIKQEYAEHIEISEEVQ